LRSEVPVAVGSVFSLPPATAITGRSGLIHGHDDHYRARQTPARNSAIRRPQVGVADADCPVLSVSAASPHVEQNRCDQRVRGRSIPPSLCYGDYHTQSRGCLCGGYL